LEIGEEGIGIGDPMGSERSESVSENDPGRDGGGEVFGVERAERDVFPGLNVACRP